MSAYNLANNFNVIILSEIVLCSTIYISSEISSFLATRPPQTHKKLDREVFIKIYEEYLPSDGIMVYLRNHDFAGAHNMKNLDKLFEFTDRCHNDPTLNFMDEELEKLRQNLLQACYTFNSKLSEYCSGAYPIRRVPTELRDAVFHCDTPENRGKAELYEQRTKELNTLVEELCSAYDDLVSTARRKILIDGVM